MMDIDDSGQGDWLERRRRQVDPQLHEIFRHSFELGFLGGMPIEDQMDHALGFVEVIESELGAPPDSVVDLGTGGGMPGLVLSSCWPETRVVLMDANQRRTEFLVEVVEMWPRSSRAEVVRGRAEEMGRRPDLRESFAVVTSRSFGIPSATAECASPLLKVGGVMVISEPPDSRAGERWPVGGLELLGLEPESSVRPGGVFGYQVIRKVAPLSDRYPRRTGIPVKRPLF
jgi:16S rRNA (guanine527-N7)-methyltransferase